MAKTDSETSKYLLKMTGSILGFFLNLIFYMIVFVLVVKAGTFAYDFAYQVFGSVSMASEPGITVEFHVSEGETTMNIAAKLENSKLIKNRYAFALKVKLEEANIKPGTYILKTSMDYNKILDQITSVSNSIE